MSALIKKKVFLYLIMVTLSGIKIKHDKGLHILVLHPLLAQALREILPALECAFMQSAGWKFPVT